MSRFWHRRLGVLILGLACGVLGWSGPARACTGIVIQAEDSSVVYARTMEFGADLVSFQLLLQTPRADDGPEPARLDGGRLFTMDANSPEQVENVSGGLR